MSEVPFCMELVPEGVSVVPWATIEQTLPSRRQESPAIYRAKRPTLRDVYDAKRPTLRDVYGAKRPTMSEMFCPPNPKLLESARSHFFSRAVLGT